MKRLNIFDDIKKCRDISGPVDLDNIVNTEGMPDKDIFEKQYIDMIAALGKDNNSPHWWASALSEKNSFASKLFSRMYKLVYLNRRLETDKKACINVKCSDPVLVNQIFLNYKKEFSIDCSTKMFIGLRLGRIRSWVAGIFRLLKKSIEKYINVLYTRKALKGIRITAGKKPGYTVLATNADHRNYGFGKYQDPYFKRLPEFLSGEGKNVLIFSRILSDYRNMVSNFAGDKENKIITSDMYLKGSDIAGSLLAAFFKRPRLRGKVVFNGIDITGLLRDELFRDISTGNFLSSLVWYYSCKRLAESVPVERFIYTFENYAWEKTGIMGLRAGNPSIKIVGFQHAFISRNSFKYLPGAGEEKTLPLPDKIVTMGLKTKDILKRLGNYPEDIISTGCALRQEYLSGVKVLDRNSSGDIFVPLTITIDDTLKVFRFLYDAGLGKRPEKIYFRFHPATPVDKVLQSLDFDLPKNFIVSENPSMEEEMSRAGIVLYTWTTVCLEALKMGRPVIYLDVNFPMDVDPLFECGYLKETCSVPGDLIGKIDSLKSMDNGAFNKDLRGAQEYLDGYFYPVNKENMAVFLSS